MTLIRVLLALPLMAVASVFIGAAMVFAYLGVKIGGVE